MILRTTEQSKTYTRGEHIIEAPLSSQVHEFKVSFDQRNWRDTNEVLGILFIEITDGGEWLPKAQVAIHKVKDDAGNFLETNDITYKALNHSKQGRMRLRFVPNETLRGSIDLEVTENIEDGSSI